jgi:hypothetical protein
MGLLELLGWLGPFTQLALVVGCFATIFLIAFNRTAANNLTLFLQSLHKIWSQRQITIEVIQKNPPSSDVDNDLRLIACHAKEREGTREEQVMSKMKL